LPCSLNPLGPEREAAASLRPDLRKGLHASAGPDWPTLRRIASVGCPHRGRLPHYERTVCHTDALPSGALPETR